MEQEEIGLVGLRSLDEGEAAAACGGPIPGTHLMFSDLEAFMGETSPYRKLRVLPHLDHAFPFENVEALYESFHEFRRP